MLKLEKKCRHFLMEHIALIAILAIFLIGIAMRWALIPHVSGDFQIFNLPWFKEMRSIGGNAMVEEQRFNYSPLFFYVFKIVADLFPSCDAHLLCKLISVLPEMALSLFGFWMIHHMQTRKTPVFTVSAFAAFWLNPLLLLNASAWGQTDSYYAFFSLLAIFLLVKKQPVWAMAAFGVSCAWKLQGLFLLPLFILAYFSSEKPFSLLWFLLIPLIMLLSSLPMGLMQMNPLQIFDTFFSQVSEYQVTLSMNYPNLYDLIPDGPQNYRIFSSLGYGLLAGAFCLCAAWMIHRKIVLKGNMLVITGAWCVLMCTYFLPCMHERYSFVGELLLLCHALLSRRPSAMAAAGLCILAIVNLYCRYLASFLFPLEISMLLLAVSLVLTTRELVLTAKPQYQPAEG